MALILVVGAGSALLEGVSQTLVAFGHRVVVAGDIAEAANTLGATLPLIAIVEQGELARSDATCQLTLARGGAVVAFQGEEGDADPLPYRLRRTVIAKLQLPLERQRLLALVRYVEDRAHTAGRDAGEDGLAEEFSAW
ncbi:MAG: hypothetical protein H0T48_10300 [Gemmatimonadaceae bacterium]|nr:hypothetical protein [Gemmatimonadaceae bacterium]